MSLIKLNEIITGDKILTLCDYIIITPDSYNFHKNILNYVNPNNLIVINDFTNIEIVKKINYFFLNTNKNHIKLFIYNYIVDDFIKYILDYLDKSLSFTIYLHNGDTTFGNNDLHKKLILNPLIKNIYAQNLNYPEDNSKLKLLPIGIANSMWGHGDLSILYDIILKNNIKNKNIYINLTLSTYKYREQVYNYLIKYNIKLNNKKSFNCYLEELSEYRFCLCVRGNGIDTHRFYECLYLKVIPVIINNSNTDMNNFIHYLNKLNLPFIEIKDELLDTIINKYFLTNFFNEDTYNKIMNNYPNYMEKIKLDFYK